MRKWYALLPHCIESVLRKKKHNREGRRKKKREEVVTPKTNNLKRAEKS